MAYRVGIVGFPNTGKSFSRTTLRDPEKVFVISPSQKMTYLKDKNDKALKRADITFNTPDGKAMSYSDSVESGALPKDFLSGVLRDRKILKDLKVTGNYTVVRDLKELSYWTHLLNFLRTDIETLILPDFTHYVSAIISNPEFIKRKAGGEAFQRFWELAGETLNAYFLNIDNLRDDLIVVTEFHSEYVESEDEYRIFVPAGKMLQEKFLPDSYYDILVYTKVLSEEVEPKQEKRYKFVVNRSGRYPGRSANAFIGTSEIPNDLQHLLDAVKKSIGI